MSQEIEIEFKNLLTKQEYVHFLTYFKLSDKAPITQTNIYFDTLNQDLGKNLSALRARFKDDIIELTLKQTINEGVLETTDIINQETFTELIKSNYLPNGNVKTVLIEAGITSTFYHLATLTTYRHELNIDQFIIALDKSNYYNCTDYELEIECLNYQDGKSYFERILNQFSIPLRPTKHKVVRAYEYKQKLKKI